MTQHAVTALLHSCRNGQFRERIKTLLTCEALVRLLWLLRPHQAGNVCERHSPVVCSRGQASSRWQGQASANMQLTTPASSPARRNEARIHPMSTLSPQWPELDPAPRRQTHLYQQQVLHKGGDPLIRCTTTQPRLHSHSTAAWRSPVSLDASRYTSAAWCSRDSWSAGCEPSRPASSCSARP